MVRGGCKNMLIIDNKKLSKLEEILYKETLLEKVCSKNTKGIYEFIESSEDFTRPGRDSLILDPSDDGTLVSSPNDYVASQHFVIKKKLRYMDITTHRHNYLEMVYVYSGTLTQTINNQSITMNAGEICILDTKAKHSIKALNSQDLAINFILTPEFFDGVFMTLLSDQNYVSNFIINSIYNRHKFNSFIVFHTSENKTIQNIMYNLLTEYYLPEMGSTAAINGYFLLLFTALSRAYEFNATHEQINSVNMEVKSDLLKYLRKNYKTATLNSTALYFHFHPNYLSNLIKKEFGKTFKELLTPIRLKQACSLLEHSEETIEKIIEQVGYTNSSHFYRLFKKYYKMTPYEFRKKSNGINE